MKKKNLIIFIFFLITIFTIYKINSNNNYKLNNLAQNNYEKKYPIENYVDEKENAFDFYKTSIINLLLNNEKIINSNNKVHTFITTLLTPKENFAKEVKKKQYKEQSFIYLTNVKNDPSHNFEFHGVLKDGTKTNGNIAIYSNSSNNYSIAISLKNNNKIDKNKCLLLMDDSTSELLTYYIIEKTQEMYGTDLEPNKAAKYFYNSTIEQIAGSISYHAFISYYLSDDDIGKNNILIHTRVINISKIDTDSFYINRRY